MHKYSLGEDDLLDFQDMQLKKEKQEQLLIQKIILY